MKTEEELRELLARYYKFSHGEDNAYGTGFIKAIKWVLDDEE